MLALDQFMPKKLSLIMASQHRRSTVADVGEVSNWKQATTLKDGL